MLRCADAQRGGEALRRIDQMFNEALARILNIDLRQCHLQQAGLPLRMGGLGIRSVRDLEVPCIPSSLHSTESLARESAMFSLLLIDAIRFGGEVLLAR